MSPEVLAPLLASAQASHAALVVLARAATSRDESEDLWTAAGSAHRITSNLCELLAVASLEKENR